MDSDTVWLLALAAAFMPRESRNSILGIAIVSKIEQKKKL
jgi:hypothetical protein